MEQFAYSVVVNSKYVYAFKSALCYEKNLSNNNKND